jgi:hypothetical protein
MEAHHAGGRSLSPYSIASCTKLTESTSLEGQEPQRKSSEADPKGSASLHEFHVVGGGERNHRFAPPKSRTPIK